MGTITTVGAVGGGDLKAAAEEIARTARVMGAWSKRIPAEIHVDVAGDTATIWTEVPAAYPAEMQARHPLFGNRKHWYPPAEKQKPFLRPAADLRAGAAMARYAKKIDRMCRAAGFR